MPNIENKILEKKYNRLERFQPDPRTFDREQLQTVFYYGIIVFAVVGGLASLTYMTVQQLKK